MVSEHSSGIRAGDKGRKEAGGAQLKRVELLETELGHLYDRMENPGHLIQHTADSIASLQLKMEQKFEEVLMAIAKSHPEEPNGKKSVGEEHNSDPVFSWVETTKGTNPTGFSGGSRNGTGGGSDGGGGGGGHTTGGEYNGGTNWRIKKLEIPLFNGNNSNG
ncbi:unnamed protein product [Lactuca saligna]|uniref:Uncharacterized protein n=1 Tax=Lactuca saligna TaxID=75948 RepID=A0AA35ZV18_LACSI|nr:unnamed protein product [Lactuca saligna]